MIVTIINTEEEYKFLINIFFNNGKHSTNRYQLYSLEVKRNNNNNNKTASEKWLINPPEMRDNLYDYKYSFKCWRYCTDYDNSIIIIKNDTNNFNVIASDYIYYQDGSSDFFSKSITINHQTHCLEVHSNYN